MNQITKEHDLKVEIEKLRQILSKEIDKSDYLNYRILNVSQELDVLIAQYYKTK